MCWVGAPWKLSKPERAETLYDECGEVSNESPVLLDRFLNDAIEVDVDAICDGKM